VATNKDFIVKNGLSVGEDISVSGSVTSNLQFDNSVQAQFGTNSDLQIYHNGSYSVIKEAGLGDLEIQTNGSEIQLTGNAGTDYMLRAISNGAVKLYYDNSPKLATTSTGIDVTGNAVLTGELRGPATFTIDPAAIGDNTGEVVIKGDLTVEGTTTTVNSTQLDIADKNITLNVGSGDTSATANNAGITVQDAIDASTDATILWNQLDERFDFSHPIAAGRFSRLGLAGTESIFTHSTTNNSAIICSGSDNMEIRGRLSDNYQIYAKSGGNVGIGKIPGSVKLDVAGDITSSGTITGSDFSGITMGGSLSGSHDDAKVQYGTSFVGTAAQGHFFFDSLNQKLKVYTGSAFVDAVPAGGGGGGGSGSSDATATFRKYTYTLTGTTNAISGKEDDEVTTGDFISGRLYEITAVGNTDFTAIGASSNAIGVQFTATDVGGGTTGKAKEVLFYATGGTQNIEVYVNGVKAVEGTSNDYVATTGTSVTFTSNLVSGDVVDVQVYELLTQDSFYLKTQTYTQAQIVAGFVAKSGDTMTGNLAVEKSANPALTVTETGAGAVTIQGTGSGGRVYSNSGNKLLIGADGQNSHLNINTNGNVGIGAGLTTPLGMLHVRDSAQAGAQHTYIYDGTSVTVEATEPSLQLIAEDSGTHGGSILWRYGNNAFAAIANPTDDTIDFTYGVSTADEFQVHSGTNMSSYRKIMSIGADGNVGIGESSPFARSHIKDVGWSSGAPYGTVQLIEGAAVNDNNWGHLVVTDTDTAVGQGGAISFATGASSSMNPFSGIKGVSEGASWGGIGFYSRPQSGTATQRVILDSNGHFKPSADATYDLGSNTLAWRNVYTNDLHLSNEGHEEGNSVDGTKGNWTIQEGEEHLYIINNKSGKKYKFALEEIE